MTAYTTTAEAVTGGLPGVRLVLRRIWWVAVGAVVGLLAGLVAGHAQAPTYQATAYLAVAPLPGQGADPTNLARAAQALARLATAPGVVGPSLGGAGFGDAAADPQLFVQVQAAPDAPIVSVTGSGEDARTAQAIASSVSRTLVALRPFADFQTTLVTAAQLPQAPTTPGWAVPAGGAGIGTAVALVLATTVPRRRRRDDAELADPLIER
jgi:hypothetical protein